MKKSQRLLSMLLVCCMAVGMLPVLTTSALAYDMGKVNQLNTISAGEYQAATITQDGSLWSWGDDNRVYPDPNEPVKLMEDVVSVSAGWGYAAAIRNDSSLWTWGAMYTGRDDGTFHYETNYPDGPYPTKLMENVIAVSTGRYHLAAIRSDNSLWTWGGNEKGQLGNGTNNYSKDPIKIMDNVIAVSAGGDFTAAITSDGSLWTWGGNSHGQLGNGSTMDTNMPIKVMDDVIAVSAGMAHTAAVTSDGTLWTWGWNVHGQLGNGGVGNIIDRLGSLMSGDGVLPYSQTRPYEVMNNIKTVSAGGWHTAAVDSDGSLWTWGDNSVGRLGNGTTSQENVPVKIMDNVIAVSAGGYLTMALCTDGSLWTWGDNSSGELGNGGLGNSETAYGYPYQTVPMKVMDNVALPIDSTEPTVGGFTDVNQNSYYADAVLWAVENGITNGTSKTTFSPDATCNQAQILTFLWRAKGKPAPTTAVTGDYYAEAAQWAKEKGLTDNFSADAPCTRAMVVTYLWKLAGSPNVGLSTFSDVPANADYSQAVAWAVTQGVTTGTSTTNNTFSPDMTCTRGQIVTFLYRANIAQTVESEPLVTYNGLQYKLVAHDIQKGNVRNINISEWHPLMGFTQTMLSPADGVDETESGNPVLNKVGDAIGFITGFIGNSYEITNLRVITNSDMEMIIQYGEPIELNKSGKKTSLNNLLIEKYSSAYPSILFSSDKKADELIRSWFGLDGDGQYSMEMEFGRVYLGDCGYYLTIQDGEVYQIPILHDDTRLNVYYKEGRESRLLFDATDVLRNIKIKMSEEESIKVINRLNSEGYYIE